MDREGTRVSLRAVPLPRLLPIIPVLVVCQVEVMGVDRPDDVTCIRAKGDTFTLAMQVIGNLIIAGVL